MTDDPAPNAEAGDVEVEPRRHTTVQVRRPDGTWETLEPRNHETGDPALDELWRLPLQDLQAILDDPSDTRHAKAQQVARELFEPLRVALEAAVAPGMQELSQSIARVAGNLIPPEPQRVDDEKWLSSVITPLAVPEPRADVYEIGPDTTADALLAATDRVTQSIKEQTQSERDAREQDRLEQGRKDATEQRRHRTILIWTIIGVGVAVLAIVVPLLAASISASRPARTSSVACGEVTTAWRVYGMVADRSSGRGDPELVAARDSMLARWESALRDAPEWSISTVNAAATALTAAAGGGGSSDDALANYAASQTYLQTFAEECQSEGNLPDSFELG